MARLETNYLGLKLAHPFVPSASPLTRERKSIDGLVEAGASAVVVESLFEEEITPLRRAVRFNPVTHTNDYGESLSFMAAPLERTYGAQEHLRRLEDIRRNTPVPIIASLNGTSRGPWLDYASLVENTGVAALELNIYFLATDPNVDSASVERRYLDIVEQVVHQVSIPVSVKLSPYITSLPNFARHLVEIGAQGLVMFNRFYQPDIDVNRQALRLTLEPSRPGEGRLVSRWIALLWARLRTSFAATSGIYSSDDALKLVAAGADVTMLCSLLLKEGSQGLTRIRDDLEHWLDEHEYASLDDLRGTMSQRFCPDPEGYERANYIRLLRKQIT